ncbi:OmpP1/FadL family transporter [Hymenobacter volaticus]|uniref:Aromatic hydrocarbon degradation protein n=1 Tax=Hymenobacter volaticus TaxID=2932254 RepID=A0ABY4G573_9BACT|nr:hypothetical protein [Hymenobacter volaticus]UOQ66044.1 hypothetical protein MUN86_21440 [Hymenobacter volaticus]
MKNLKYWLAVALLSPASHSFAQYATDALRFSQTQPSGTARSLGVGGANVAVGSDLGNLVTNPAGLGLFQRSEVSFTPGVGIGNTDSQVYGTTTTDGRNSVHVANFGVAFANRRPDTDNSPWRGGTLAIGLNRINDFNQSFRYRGSFAGGPSRAGSNILNYFNRGITVEQANDFDDLAYEAFLTEEDPKGRYVPSDYDQARLGSLNQDETVLTTGSQTQFDIGYGASYRDRLYIGGAIGIVSTRFNSTSTLTATDPSPANGQIEGTNFGSLTYREVLETRGSGINARIGAIYRVNDAVRVGASVQTPTLHSLSETYSSSLNVVYDTPITIEGKTYSSGNAATDPGTFDYRLTSPFRASGGAAVVIGKHGFLSGDVEYVNYGQARLNNDNTNDAGASSVYDFGDDNDDVKALYQSAVNLRLGGELRYDIFRFRAGFAHYGDPYKANTRDRSQSYYTGGVGLRQKNFFLDLAGVYNTAKRYYNPYVMPRLEDTPEVVVDANRFTTTITAGFLF